MIKPVSILLHPVHFLSLGLGSGLSPKAPGTMGTLVAVMLYWPLSLLPWQAYLSVVVIASLLGIWLCQKTADALGVHDHPAIVWDEFAGYWLSMLFAPGGWQWVVTGFVLFRLFDIWKPWPIRVIDHKLEGGTGIMLDDLLAGLYSFICIQLLALLINGSM